MDIIQKYLDGTNKGQQITIHQEGTIFFLDFQKFDEDTGTEIDPERIPIDASNLQNLQNDLQTRVSVVGDIITQLQSLPDSPPMNIPISVPSLPSKPVGVPISKVQ